MQESIKIIFQKNLLLFEQIEKSIFHFRSQNFDPALRLTTNMLDQISSWLNYVVEGAAYFNENHSVVEVTYLMDTLNSLLSAQENKDYVLLADIYEGQLLPIVSEIQNVIMDKEGFFLDEEIYKNNVEIVKNSDIPIKVSYSSINELLGNIEEGYSIEYNAKGQYTLAVSHGAEHTYYHSNNCVVKESLQLTNHWYSDAKDTYIIYGLGLGYHVSELFYLDKNLTIEIYESDSNIIQLACAFSKIGALLKNKNIRLIYDPSFTKLSKRLQSVGNDEEFVIHYPSLRNIKDIKVRENLENYFLQYSSVKNQLRLLNGNFKKNILCYDGIVDELKSDFCGKNLYIVAAGPSLDNNFLQLKELKDKEDSIILATGTVFRKLLKAGIKPDYFIVTDANERVYGQIRGLEQETIPMLYLSTAYHGFSSNYRGKKYLILQKDYDKSEQYAREKSSNLYKTGGSVSTTALDIGITLGCRRIIFLGLDLAYPNNHVHALDTSRRELASTSDLRQVEDINGNQVSTSKSLSIYKEWMEERIKDVKDVEFIDATEGGAKVKGFKIKKLREVI